MTDATLAPPEPDEVEVSIFGPGKGESIAVHVGAGDWIIVDSCVDHVSKQIPVLTYLRDMGVDVCKDVRLVVGTHAHDDHIAGLSRVLDECSAATFVCSSALTSEEFVAGVLEADADIEALFRKSIRSEYRRIYEILDQRDPGAGKYALEQRLLWSRDASATAPGATVTALSPSDHAIRRSIEKLATGLAKAGDRRRLVSADPNEFAVALSVTVGDTAMLLGADLERGPQGCGWGAVLATFRPDTLASVFKIPHHGSENAHHEDVWSQLVTAEVISLLAPYRPGRKPLPSPTDIDRIKATSKAVYCSAKPQAALAKAVKKTRASLTGLGTNVRAWGKAGQVRARRVCGVPDWDVTTFDPALQL